MVIRRFAFVLPLVLLPAAADAHEHNAELSAAFSYLHGSTLLGPQVAFEWVPGGHPTHLARDRTWGVVGDVSAHFDGDHKEYTFLLGVRKSGGCGLPAGWSCSGQLLGGYQVSRGFGDSGFALAPAAGLERFWGRAGSKTEWGVRFESGFICQVTGEEGCDLHASVGVTLRFRTPRTPTEHRLLPGK